MEITMKANNLFSRLCGIALIVALAACSSVTKVESDLGIKGAPDWVNEGTQLLGNKNGRLFHGVGSAAAMGDPALQKSVADDRARAEVARILSSYLEVVSSDYVAAEKAAKINVNEEAVSRQIKNVSKVNLSGSRIIGSWRDTETNIIYSIAELDMEQVKSTLATVSEMNEDLRLYIDVRAENVFDSIKKEKK